MRMRHLALPAAILAIALLGFGLVSKGVNGRIDDQLRQGRPAEAPGFDLELLASGEGLGPLAQTVADASADGRVSLDELRGTPVVLNFWASWCPPCREEAPMLEAGWERDRQRGVLYLGLDMQDLTGDARDFIAEFSLTYPNVRDPGRDVATEYGAIGIPETYFVDSRGEVVGHVIGVVDRETLASGVAAARTGRVAGVIEAGDQRPQR